MRNDILHEERRQECQQRLLVTQANNKTLYLWATCRECSAAGLDGFLGSSEP
jgi:hypothetical protein